MSPQRPNHTLSRPTGFGLCTRVGPPSHSENTPLASAPGALLNIAAAGPSASASSHTLIAHDALSVQQRPGKGLALIAARPLRAGSLILRDTPLISLRPNEDLPELASAYDALSPAQQESYSALSAPAHSPRIDNLTAKLRARGMSEAAIQRLARVAAIFYANAFNLRASGSEDGGPVTLRAVFARVARANHSCAPSAHAVYVPAEDGAEGEMRVTMLRDVQPGEEVTLAYFSPLGTRAERQERARDWGFVCGCEVCGHGDEEGGADAEESTAADALTQSRHELESRRTQIRGLQESLKAGSGRGSDGPTPDAASTEAQALQLVALCREEPALRGTLPGALEVLGRRRISAGTQASLVLAAFEEALEVEVGLGGVDAPLARLRRSMLEEVRWGLSG